MHTDTQPRLRHRHFVAAPLFALLLGLPLLSGDGRQAAASAIVQSTETATDRPVAPGNGMRGVLFAGGRLDGNGDALFLSRGSVLLTGDGLVRLRAGSAVLTALGGALRVGADAGALTVAAIDTPVVVSFGDRVLIVPAGMQRRWEADAPAMEGAEGLADQIHFLLALPSEFLREQVSLLRGLPADGTSATPGATLLPPMPSALLFPAAQERALERDGEEKVRKLAMSIAAGDGAAARGFLADEAVRLALRQADAEALSRLLNASLSSPSVLLDLLPFVSDTDLLLLGCVHPALRDAFWTADAALMLSPSALQTCLYQVPSSDLQAEALSDLVHDRWFGHLQTFLAASPASGAELSAFLRSMAPFRARLVRREYPERLRRYGADIDLLSRDLRDVLTDAAKGEVSAWAETVAPPPATEPDFPEPEVILSASSASSEARPPEHPDQTRATVYEALRAAGALFTTQTVIRAVTDDSAAVEGILFSTAAGDHSYDFTFDVARTELQDIRRDGVPLPYNLPLDAFLKWVNGDTSGS